jgi:hypothetical protein
MTHEPEVKDHLERDVKTVCGYCGRVFEIDEVVVEREVNGRMWKFCDQKCYDDFMDALDFTDEDLDSYEAGVAAELDDEE